MEPIERSAMTLSEHTEIEGKNKTFPKYVPSKLLLWICTLVYALSFPFVFIYSFFLPLDFIKTTPEYTHTFLTRFALGIAPAMNLSVILMWVSYLKKNGKRFYFCCALPLLFFLAVKISIIGAEELFRRWFRQPTTIHSTQKVFGSTWNSTSLIEKLFWDRSLSS